MKRLAGKGKKPKSVEAESELAIAHTR